jgi:hypothetical protein
MWGFNPGPLITRTLFAVFGSGFGWSTGTNREGHAFTRSTKSRAEDATALLTGTNREGHAFTRAIKSRAEGAPALPKA